MKTEIKFCCENPIFKFCDINHTLEQDDENPASYMGAAFGQVQCVSCNKTFHFLLPNGIVILDDERYESIKM